MTDVACPACGTSNSADQKFCGACGTSLERSCSACGSSNPVGFRFCGSCGSSLEAETARVAPGVEERRWATVLFADMSGFTRMSERTDPEDVRSFVDMFMAVMGDIVTKFGGFVSRVAGDEMLALFGAPVAHEDDPERAVRTALEMQRAASERAEELGHMRLRIGVNTGELMFAPLGPGGAREHTVMGDVVNTAKRLETAAPLDGVLVGEETYRSTRAAIRYDPFEPVSAKGKEQPVQAWLAVESVGEVGDRPVSEAPVVGRTRELELLRTVWSRTVAEAQPQLVTVTGAPGIGKTRLLREFVTGLASDVRVLRGRSLPYGERTGYGAFAEQVKGACGIFETDPAPIARQKLEEFAASLFPAGEASQVASHVGVLMGLGADGVVGDRQQLFFSARRMVEALSAQSPLVLVFEDVHWADNSALDLVEMLAGRLRESPVLLLTLARPELFDLRPTWGGGLGTATMLALDSLSVSDSRMLVSRLLPGVVDAEVLDRLADTAGGNPLFLEEMAASFSERTTEIVGKLPTTVQGMIAARLDSLPPTERRVLFDAAVVGKIFWRGVLEAIAPDEPVWEALDSLRGRDLVRREPSSRIEGDEEYSFKHMLIREVAYATLPKATRRQRHADVAGFVEGAAGDRVEEYASLLAHHFREAGDEARAADYLIRAAEHAGRSSAAAEQITLYEQSLELLDPADPRRAGVMLARALARARAGDMKAAAAELDEMLPGLGGRDRVEALYVRAKAAFWLSDVPSLSVHGDELSRLGEQMDDETSRVLGLSMSAYSGSLVGDLKGAVRAGERALALWTPDAPAAEHASMHAWLGLARYWLGDLRDALDLQERAVRMAERTPSAEALLLGGANHAMTLGALGRYEEALELLEDLVAKGSELELAPRWTPRAMNIWAGTLRDIGDEAAARELNQRAAEEAESVFPTGVVQAHVDLLFGDLSTGDVGRADTMWPKIREEAGSLHGFHEWLVEGRLLEALAEIHLAAGRMDAAADAAVASIEHADRYGRLKYSTMARCVLGAALASLGREEEALGHLRGAATDAERLGHPPTLWRAFARLGAVQSAMGDDEGAEASSARARRAHNQVAESLSPERREVFLATHIPS